MLIWPNTMTTPHRSSGLNPPKPFWPNSIAVLYHPFESVHQLERTKSRSSALFPMRGSHNCRAPVRSDPVRRPPSCSAPLDGRNVDVVHDIPYLHTQKEGVAEWQSMPKRAG